MRPDWVTPAVLVGTLGVCCGLHLLAVGVLGVAVGTASLALGLGVVALAAFGLVGITVARYLRR